MLTGQLHIFFGEMSIHIFLALLSWELFIVLCIFFPYLICNLRKFFSVLCVIFWSSWCLLNHKSFKFQKKKNKVTLKSFWGNICILKGSLGTFLVAQWLRTCLPMQGTQVRALVQEDPTCRGATKPVCHNYWACALAPASHNYWARA